MLSRYTTLRIGGPAKAIFEVASPDEVVAATRDAEDRGLPWRIIGHGSNILAPDDGVSSAVVVFKDSTLPRIDAFGTVRVSGGYPLDAFVRFLVSHGFAGLEALAGIPGTVGGAIAGNAGAYGTWIGTHVRSAKLLWRDGRLREAEASALAFAYRRSILRDTREAVLEATFTLSPAEPAALERTMQEKLADRRAKHPDPATTPTAGSWFKNVRAADGTMTPAGRLLDEAGCRELRVGGASLWPRHANIVVSDGTATAAQVRQLTGEMAARVLGRFGVQLVEEVCHLD